MSRNTPTPEQIRLRLERAARFRVIRDATGLTQPDFAERLTRLAAELRLENVSYKVGDITTREKGRKDLEIEDYVLAAHVDPHHRSVLWLAFGREVPIKYLGMMPKPPTAVPALVAPDEKAKRPKSRS